jgi:PRTRC genetic system ThiF family protein
MLRPWKHLQLVLVGVGGTGSRLAPYLALLVKILRERGRVVSLVLVDPDVVEAKNCYRQNFCDADVRLDRPLHKADVMSLRLNMAWHGVESDAVCETFSLDLLEGYPREEYQSQQQVERLTVVVDSTDNAAARAEIFKVLEANNGWEAPRFWVLHCGNFAGSETGQVILGSAISHEHMRQAFKFSGRAIALPSPALHAPSLLVPRAEELDGGGGLSCAEVSFLNAQGLMINAHVAVEAASYLFEMLLPGYGGLKRFASFINVPAGKKDSLYITPEEVGTIIGKDAEFFKQR